MCSYPAGASGSGARDAAFPNTREIASSAEPPSANRIVSFRNRIIHGYDAVDDATVWGVVESHLLRLIAEVEALLREAGESV